MEYTILRTSLTKFSIIFAIQGYLVDEFSKINTYTILKGKRGLNTSKECNSLSNSTTYTLLIKEQTRSITPATDFFVKIKESLR